ncbi:DUF3261 domain-containing protein [Amphritea sp.]|uniref:DUF3261 domain-containing protein n=1 Tax=Amphritea sp. TaxID=1872502 RepID=UPI0025C01896|nr:DUF3261 domain-containing protein [Amphritea sp.]
MSQLNSKLKTSLIRTGCALLLLLLAGCSSLGTVERPAEMLLLKPAQGPVPVLLTQRVTLSSWGQQKQFVAIARFTYGQSKLVALLPTGQQLLYLEFDGEQLVQRAMPSIELPGKDILALIQFALWPRDALQSNYRSEQGWKVDITDRRRELTHNDNPWLDVRYDGQQINIYNYLSKYRVLIETLEQKDLVP